ncbi:hypothetical protein HC246_24095 [Pseudanabaena yagii GIHE-NHR1]|uniref:Orotate phosphoribosyltransferase n=1 Tax=Pseudanabaena yagii GIHE-NHR1 TaxID=2722753 RepID=A0ABX1LXY0_9CYAN|nr:hypothetical protein [Pseudanabaena yagii]NMF61024.1 hypothetical protein [Pseudanabaena yagii GIHE-NHR1]
MTQDSKIQIARDIHRHCYLTGSFTLRSGRIATEYFDKYQFEALPSLLSTGQKVAKVGREGFYKR